MTKEELDKKLKSFSEHSGLGKTYTHYEVTSTSKREFVPVNPGDNLPANFTINIKPDRKTEMIFLTILAAIFVLVLIAFRSLGPLNYSFFFFIPVMFATALSGLFFIAKDEKKRINLLCLSEKDVRYNNDVFVYTTIEDSLIKKDLNAKGKLITLWLIIALKTGEIYCYDIPKGYLHKKIKGKYKLEELLFLHRENYVLRSKIKTGISL